MKLNPDTVPTTLDEAVTMLVAGASPTEVEFIRDPKSVPGSTHHFFGRELRNGWSLWQDTPLVRDIKTRFKIFGHGDDMSGIILHCFWREVRGQSWDVEPVVERYRQHWRRMGVDPETGVEVKSLVGGVEQPGSSAGS